MDKFTAVLLIETDEMIGGKGIAHRLQRFRAELRQHPAAEYQLVFESTH